MTLSAADYINNFTLYFDGGDVTNASLYLCIGKELSPGHAHSIIHSMREAGLWSEEPAKTVPNEQKPMYVEQMRFIGAVEASLDGKPFHAAAYDHDKFKYTPSRWQEWKSYLAKKY